MHDSSLAGLDLNLLVVLDALLRERHVTRAAKALGLSQSATSHALARLRTVVGDPLLVRDKNNLVATARADALREPLAAALAALGDVLKPPEAFDAATSRRTFTIAAADYGQLVVLPPLVGRLAELAPGLDLVVRDLGAASFIDSLAAGDSDLAIVPPLGGVRAGASKLRGSTSIHERRLFSERFVCVVRAGHPRVKKRLDLATFVDLPHAFVAPRGTRGGVVDDVLAERGLERRVALMLQNFLIAPWAVASSDMVVTIAERVARVFMAGTGPAGALALRMFPPPVPLPGFTIHLAWHASKHLDPAHRWLRQLIVETCRDV